MNPLSRVVAKGIDDHKGLLDRMAVEAFECAEFVTRQAWRNTSHVHFGVTVLAARALEHAEGRISWQWVRAGHVRPPLDRAGARYCRTPGPDPVIFMPLKTVR